MILKLKVLGVPFEIDREEGTGYRPTALVCPSCLTAWATFDGVFPIRYNLCATACKACPEAVLWPIHPVPGSLIDDWRGIHTYDEYMLDALTPALLRREFYLTLEAWEKIWIPQSQFSQESTSSLRVPQGPEKLTHSEQS